MIDAHHHFWVYDPVLYSWIGPEMQVLQRDFGPSDLLNTTEDLGITGVVSVQAEQSLDETRRLLHHAQTVSLVKGVVGWAPLIDPKLNELLPLMCAESKLKGLRHILQDEPDPNYMLRADFNAGIEALQPFNLVYDILIFERHLPQTIEFVDRHPHQPFVLDHLGKPKLGSTFRREWAQGLRELARRPNLFCKLSGLVTEAEQFHWSEEQVLPYLDTALECFGPNRLMWGSDWPVCLLATSYRGWLAIVRNWARQLSQDEQDAIFRATATRVYHLPPVS